MAAGAAGGILDPLGVLQTSTTRTHARTHDSVPPLVVGGVSAYGPDRVVVLVGVDVCRWVRACVCVPVFSYVLFCIFLKTYFSVILPRNTCRGRVC